MPEEIKAYGCEHCAMTSRYKGHVVRHENHSCRKNINRVNCRSCIHLEFEDYTPATGCPIHPEIHGVFQDSEPAHWWCSADEAVENMFHEELGKTRECKNFKHFLDEQQKEHNHE